MKNKNYLIWIALIILIAFVVGCSKDKDVKETPAAGETDQAQSLEDKSVPAKEKVLPDDVAVSVDGAVLVKTQLEKQIKDIMKTYQEQIPKDKIKEKKKNSV